RGMDAGLLEETPDRLAERGAVRLGGLLDAITLTLERAVQAGHLGGLSRALDALERDQHSPPVTRLPLMQLRHSRPGRRGAQRGDAGGTVPTRQQRIPSRSSSSRL